nr:MAG TPA_asm: hypothetical protein [Caudoviricetes sp.]
METDCTTDCTSQCYSMNGNEQRQTRKTILLFCISMIDEH